MGDYKSQYERYYESLKGSDLTSNSGAKYNGSKMNNSNNNDNKLNKYIKKFVMQTISAVILLLLLLILKNIPLEEAKEAYIVSKEAVDKNINLTETVMAIDVPELDTYKEKTLDLIDRYKQLITGEKTVKEVIREKYSLPVIGSYYVLDDENIGVAIQVVEESDVLASYDGKVSEVKTVDGETHITIYHSNGVETYYGLLTNVSVKEGDKVKKGQSIGKTGIIDSIGSKGMVYKIIYMGIEKNPTELIDFSNLQNV